MIARDDGRAVGHAPREVLVGAVVLAWLLGRAGDELLAVEHRRAAARAGGARRLPLGRCGATLYRRRRRCSRWRCWSLAARARRAALRPEGQRRLGEQRDQRAREADRRRPRTVRRTAAAGLRLGLVRRRSTSATRAPARRPENATSASHTIPVTVAAEQGHPRVWRCTWRCSSSPSSCCSPAPAARRRGSRSPRASRRSCCTRGPTPTSSRTRSRGRCSAIGVALARAGGRADGARAGAARAPAARRARGTAPAAE